MKKIIFVLVILITIPINAQTGIGTTTPNASAKLDVYATNKGFLPPRVTLTSATDATTIASPAEGLLVYNLGSVGLQSGYYYWNGANWATIATASSAGNGVTSTDLVKLYGKAYSTATGDIANASGYSFTVPVSGRYLFDFSCSAWGGTATINFKVRQGTTDLGTDTQTSLNNNVHVEYNGKVEVNLQSGTTYNVYVSTTGNRDSGDYDRVYYKMVAGNLPVTGQTVEYGMARYSGADTGSLANGSIVTFDATAAGNLAWSGNKFTLKANKTYELESSLAIYLSGGGVGGRFQIYDYTNSVALANGLFMSQNGAGTYNPSANSPMKGVITPTTDIQVGVRLLDFYGPAGPGIIGSTSFTGTNSAPNASYFMVKQVGSSAIVNPWVLSGNDVYNTTGKVGIGTASPNPSALLDLSSTTKGFLPPRMTTNQRNAIIGLTAGLVVYNTTINQLEMYNGSAWSPLFTGSTMHYAQYRANAAQGSFTADVTKVNFPQNEFNIGSITVSSSNTFTLPENRIYRVDLNMGYKNGGWCRFGIYNTSTGTMISQTAHMESGTLSGSGVITYFIDTRNPASSFSFDVRMKAGGCILNDAYNGTTFATITIQSIY